jgi:sortase A
MAQILKFFGVLMILAGFGCIALFFVGPPTTGSIPTAAETPSADTAGPVDKTLYLTIPRIGLNDVKVYDSLSEDKLDESIVHVPGTGFPWQDGVNTYIAGHRLGYLGTGSWLVFYRLNELGKGDQVTLKDANGKEYAYRVTEQMVVGPEDVQVTNPVPGKRLISLQTCTLPSFSDRLIVRGELAS